MGPREEEDLKGTQARVNCCYLVGQCHDDFSEVTQRAVDVLRLLQSDPSGSGLLQPLTSGEIDLRKTSNVS